MTTDPAIAEVSLQLEKLNLSEDTTIEPTIEPKIESNVKPKGKSKGKFKEQPPKQKLPPATLYWGIELDPAVILEHPTVKSTLASHPEVIPLTKMHSTLLYVGGERNNPNEESLKPYENKLCTLTIDAVGSSLKAVALRVTDIHFQEETPDKVPTYAVLQHITVALSSDTKAVNSVKTLQGEGDIVVFEEDMELKGVIKRYIN